MDVSQCKLIVHSFFREKGDFLHHIDDKELVYKGKGYRIKPDDSYIYPEFIIAIEYEKKKLPIESISKYWWLFRNSEWPKNSPKLRCCLFVLLEDLNQIRKESLIILGNELVSQYSDKFEFKYLLPEQISKESIQKLLKSLF